jgi:hypothetical protein
MTYPGRELSHCVLRSDKVLVRSPDAGGRHSKSHPNSPVLRNRNYSFVGRLSYRIFDVGGITPMGGMMLMLVCSTILNTVKLYRAETLR